MDKIRFGEKFALFSRHWNPKVSAGVAGYLLHLTGVLSGGCNHA